MTKVIYKYATGQVIPEGAVYLSTIVGTTREHLVWHYFLVEVGEEKEVVLPPPNDGETVIKGG